MTPDREAVLAALADAAREFPEKTIGKILMNAVYASGGFKIEDATCRPYEITDAQLAVALRQVTAKAAADRSQKKRVKAALDYYEKAMKAGLVPERWATP